MPTGTAAVCCFATIEAALEDGASTVRRGPRVSDLVAFDTRWLGGSQAYRAIRLVNPEYLVRLATGTAAPPAREYGGNQPERRRRLEALLGGVTLPVNYPARPLVIIERLVATGEIVHDDMVAPVYTFLATPPQREVPYAADHARSFVGIFDLDADGGPAEVPVQFGVRCRLSDGKVTDIVRWEHL